MIAIENTTSWTIFLRWIALFMSQSTSSSVRTWTSLTSLSRVVFYFHTSCRVPHLTIPVKYFEAITSSTAKDKDRFWKSFIPIWRQSRPKYYSCAYRQIPSQWRTFFQMDQIRDAFYWAEISKSRWNFWPFSRPLWSHHQYGRPFTRQKIRY